MDIVRGRNLYLIEESVAAENSGEFRPHHLHRHLAFVLQVLGEVDGGHAARTEFPLDFVAVGEGGREAGADLGHGGLR